MEACVVWGQITGVSEANIHTFAGNWTGTGSIENVGDAERIALEDDEYMISEIVDSGVRTVTINYNKYAAGDAIDLDYRHGATPGDCVAAAWNDYTVPFASLGYVQIRITATL